LSYFQNDTLQKPIAKKPTGKALAASISQDQDICKQQQLESENENLH